MLSEACAVTETHPMTQQQSAAVLQIDGRSTERQTLFLTINSLKAAEADLDASNRAVSDDWSAKMDAGNDNPATHTDDWRAKSVFQFDVPGSVRR